MVRSYSVLSGVIESVLGFLGLFWVFRVSVLGKCKHNRHGRGLPAVLDLGDEDKGVRKNFCGP